MTYPTDTYEQRPLENLPGLMYDPENKKTLFAEDILALGAEINAIETVLNISCIEVPYLIHENTGGRTNTDYEDLLQPCVIDLSSFSNISSVVFRCDMTHGESTGVTLSAQLRNLTTNSIIEASEISATPDQYQHIIGVSEDIREYFDSGLNSCSMRLKVSGGTGYFYSCSIIVKSGV